MDLKGLIAAETVAIDLAMREDLTRQTASLDPLLAEILSYGLFSGGKRVRPLLAILGARLCGGADDAELYRLAIAFEYLHVATLFHDDVIDGAETRRGRMSVNRKYGLSGAILAGDFLHAHSMALVGRHGGTEALTKISRATRGMVDGEFLQLRHGGSLALSESDYFAVIKGKTALLIGAACEIGGLHGGADSRRRQALRTYGLNVGCAFQIIDDLLDYQGDPVKTGKAVGNDLLEGKMTLPLIYALHQARPDDRSRLQAILADPGERRLGLEEVRALITAYDGFGKAREKAKSIIAEAVAALTVFEQGSNRHSLDILLGLTRYILSRDA